MNSDLMKLTLKESTEQGIETKLALRFSNLLKTVAFIGMVASALETYDSLLKTNDSLNDSMETLGYWMKAIATGGNSVIFGTQVFLRSASLLGGELGWNIIANLVAPWMLTGFFIASVLYLVALIIINRYHRTDLEKWLRQSVWGKAPAGWSAWEEAARLEEFFSRPQVILKGVENPAIKITSLYQSTHQWQLLIDLPPFVAGEIIGLQITRMPQQQPGQIYLTAPTPALLNEQQGQFERIEQDGKQLIRYTLNCGGSTADTITVAIQMPLSWIDTKDPDDKIRTISYLCSGNKHGAQAVKPQHEFNLKIDPTKRAIKVEV